MDHKVVYSNGHVKYYVVDGQSFDSMVAAIKHLFSCGYNIDEAKQYIALLPSIAA